MAQKQSGFTLFEVILVLILMGLLAAVAAGSMTGKNDQTELLNAAAALRANMRTAVQGSLNGDDLYQVEFTAGPPVSYQLVRKRGTTEVRVPFPGAEDKVTLPDDMTLTVDLTGSALRRIAFDSYGRPCQSLPANTLDKDDVKGMSKYVANIKFTLKLGKYTQELILHHGTGYIR